MYVYVCICVCVCVCVGAYVYIYIYIYMTTTIMLHPMLLVWNVCVYDMYVFVYVCVYVRVCIYNAYKCIYIHILACVCLHCGGRENSHGSHHQISMRISTYCDLRNKWDSRNGFQGLFVPVYYWNSVGVSINFFCKSQYWFRNFTIVCAGACMYAGWWGVCMR